MSFDNDEMIQYLKHENARLIRRNVEMENYIHAIACCMAKNSKYHYTNCEHCPYWQGRCHLRNRAEIELAAVMLINELEGLSNGNDHKV